MARCPVAAASAGINMVASAGLATGLSGLGIMSGLAAYGAIVVGSAVVGMVVLGTAPALTNIVIMRRAFREDDDLPPRHATSK